MIHRGTGGAMCYLDNDIDEDMSGKNKILYQSQ